MMKKRVCRILSLILLFSGIFFMLNSQIMTIGAVIGISAIASKASSVIGLTFILVAVILFIFETAAARKPKVLEDIIEEKRGKFPEGYGKMPYLVIDSNFLIKNYKTGKERNNYVTKLMQKYNVIIPNALKKEIESLNSLNNTINFSNSKDYYNTFKEAKDFIRKTEKYKEGFEYAQSLRGKTSKKVDLNHPISQRFLEENPEIINKKSLKRFALKNALIARDADMLASAVYAERTISSKPLVFLISSDAHLSQAAKKLKWEDKELEKRFVYINPEEENIVAEIIN